MSRFNKTISSTHAVENLAGGRAFSFKPEEELLHAVMTTFLTDKFYEKGVGRMDRIKELVMKSTPEFVANLAVVARKEFHLRSVTHVLIGELARVHRGDDIVKRAIVASTERPDDLTEIAAYVNRPLTKQVKRGIRNAILKFDKYQLAKYKGEGKDFSLVDLFNLTHPKRQHATPEQLAAWDALMTGKLFRENTIENIMKDGTKDAAARKESFENLILAGKIGYMALIKNLNNLTKLGVSDDAIREAVSILIDSERVAKSKLLPSRFLTAYNEVTTNRILRDAVSEAMDIAVGNVPKLPGTTLIAVDKSGSMRGDPLEKAAILAATLMKANETSDVVLFSETAVPFVEMSSRVPVVDIANAIIEHPKTGGTNTSAIFATDKKYDRIIILSDNESWLDSVYGGGTQAAYSAYKKRLGADPFVYAIDILGYGTRDIKGGKVFPLAGFSDRILDFIGLTEKDGSLFDYVKSYSLEG